MRPETDLIPSCLSLDTLLSVALSAIIALQSPTRCYRYPWKLECEEREGGRASRGDTDATPPLAMLARSRLTAEITKGDGRQRTKARKTTDGQTDKSREGSAAGGAECHLNLKDGMRMSFRSLGSRGNCISLSKTARWQGGPWQ